MTLLGIDTSGKTASAAIVTDGSVKAQVGVYTRLTHSQVILPMVKNLLEVSETELSDVDGICVANGPGSYTGLRIGISAVKGICFAQNKKCIGISTLESLANNLYGLDTYVCAVMEARQSLVYAAVFKSSEKKVERIADDEIIEKAALFEKLKDMDQKIMLVGDGASKFAADFVCENIHSAPPQLLLQKAESICFAAMNYELYGAEKLDASYLQPTQAEKLRKE